MTFIHLGSGRSNVSALASTGARSIMILLCAGVSLWAQPVTDNDEVDELRRRAPAGGGADERTLDDYLTTLIAELSTAPDHPVAQRSFRERLSRLRDAPDTTPEFNRFLAQRLAQLAATEFAKGKTLPTHTAHSLALALIDAGDKRIAPGLTAALRYPDQPVRYHAARGLRRIRDDLTSNPQDEIAPVVAELQAAGVQEENPYIVENIYLALSFSSPTPEVFGAFVAVLEARIQRYRNGAALANNVETTALDYLAGVSIPDQMKVPIVRKLAVLLSLDVERFAQGKLLVGEADMIARRIDTCESLLERLTGRNSGDVRTKMQTGGPTAAVDMQLELLKWVGAPPQEQGALNEPPWNMPLGARE